MRRPLFYIIKWTCILDGWENCWYTWLASILVDRYWCRWHVRHISSTWSNQSPLVSSRQNERRHETCWLLNHDHFIDQCNCILPGMLQLSWRSIKLLFLCWPWCSDALPYQLHSFFGFHGLGIKKTIIEKRGLLWLLWMLLVPWGHCYVLRRPIPDWGTEELPIPGRRKWPCSSWEVPHKHFKDPPPVLLQVHNIK